jgi:hypothetical protein
MLGLKVQVKLSLCLLSNMPWQCIGKGRNRSTRSLTSALDWHERSASGPGCFTPRERFPGNHWIWGLVDPTARLDVVVKTKIPSPCWDLNPWSFSLSPSTIPLNYPSEAVFFEWPQQQPVVTKDFCHSSTEYPVKGFLLQCVLNLCCTSVTHLVSSNKNTHWATATTVIAILIFTTAGSLRYHT